MARWRPAPRLLLAAALVAWGLLEALLIEGGRPPLERCLFAVVALGSVAFLDRYPWPVLAIQLGAIGLEAQLEIFDSDEAVTPLQAVPICGWIAGAALRDTLRSALLALAAAAAILLLGSGLELPAVGIALGVGIGWAGARVVGTIGRRRALLRRRLAEAEGDREALTRSEVGEERARLARELDAVVLDAARRIDAETERAAAALASGGGGTAESLRSIASGAGEAMKRIREALALLRSDEDPEVPAEGDGLGAAIASLRSRGARVEVHDDGTSGRESTLALTRVVELAAAAPEPPQRLRVAAGRAEASVTLRYRGAAPAANREAFVRMRERAALYGGAVRMPRRRRRTIRVELPAPGREPGWAWRRAALAAATLAALLALDLWADSPAPPALGAAAAVALAAALAAWAWTRRPAALAAFAWLPILANALVGFDGLEATTIPLLALAAFLPALWIGERRPRRRLAAAVAIASAALLGTSWIANGVILTDVPIVLFLVAAGWWIGAAVRGAAGEVERMARIGWATTKADIVAAERAVEDERRRIARDLHDLVAHALAIVSVQAWGAHAALAGDPAEAARGVATIRETTATVVDELERLLRPRGAPPAPASITELVGQAREAGLPVALDGELPVATAEGTEAILRQVVREALTNVIRHAGLVPTTVSLRSLPQGLEAEITNAPGATGAAAGGLGLAGMRERLAEAGGSLDAEPLEGGGYRVRARLP